MVLADACRHADMVSDMVTRDSSTHATYFTVFCAGSLVDSGLQFGVHIGDNCPAHVLSAVQPLVQAVFMIFEIYFVFNNAKVSRQ